MNEKFVYCGQLNMNTKWRHLPKVIILRARISLNKRMNSGGGYNKGRE